MITLIPAYEPDERLVELVSDLHAALPGLHVVVVDDGSGPRYQPVFAAAQEAGAEVIGYDTNRGKGFALRAGFAHVLQRGEGCDIVSADCDGQHRPDDIIRVAVALAQHRDHITLGSRRLDQGVPIRSQFGNTLTRHVFDVATGHHIHDTQTGLRGYPAALLPWLLTVAGDRFEYELEVLLQAERRGIAVDEIPIATVYESSHSSHFRTIRDSIRVYVPFVKFSLASIASFVLDLTLFFLIYGTTGRLGVAAIFSRLTSAAFNFTLNRTVVFGAGGSTVRRSAARYAALAGSLLAVNYLVLRSLVP